MSRHVQVERRGRLAAVVWDRPPLNVFDLATIAELSGAITTLSRDDGLQMVTLTGAGERAFSAGVAVEDHVPERLDVMLESFHQLIRTVRKIPAVTLAVVDGHCLGGGLELAAACDMIVASDRSRLGQPEVRVGCLPPVAAALLPRRLPAGRAYELLLGGEPIAATEAERIGLVTRVVAAAALPAERRRLEQQITAQSAAVCRLIKRAIRAGETLPFDEALAVNEEIYRHELARTRDMREGIDAFLQKRAPSWEHR